MGYRGKVEEQNRARDLRAQAWALGEIAEELGVSKSSVSLWVREIEFDEAAQLRRSRERHAAGAAGARRRGPSALQRRKQEEIDAMAAGGRSELGQLGEREFLTAGLTYHSGEGSKTDGAVVFANTDPRLIAFFCRWLRHFFDVDESRLRMRVYLHDGLDLEAAEKFWSGLTGIPRQQFRKPYRAVADPSIRHSKHPMGCPAVLYSCSHTHRRIMGLIDALLSSEIHSGVAQLAEQGPVKATAVGSNPTPGAVSCRETSATPEPTRGVRAVMV